MQKNFSLYERLKLKLIRAKVTILNSRRKGFARIALSFQEVEDPMSICVLSSDCITDTVIILHILQARMFLLIAAKIDRNNSSVDLT